MSTTKLPTMHLSARIAHAWLRGFSDARLGKEDASRTLYPGDDSVAGHLRDGYLAGRLAA